MEERAVDGDAAAMTVLFSDLEAAFAEAHQQLAATIAGTEAGE